MAAEQPVIDAPTDQVELDTLEDLKPVRKFTDRKTAVSRIWRVIQRLVPAPTETATSGAQGAPEKASSSQDVPAREGSKKAKIIELLSRPEGATLEALMEATGWQAHSVRGFLAGTVGKKMGLVLESWKSPLGDRKYRIAKEG